MKFPVKIDSAMWREERAAVSDVDITEHMRSQGMDEVPSNLIFDGMIHRFSTDRSKPRDDAGWYSATMHKDGAKYVCFGDFRKGLSLKYIAGISGLTESQRLEIEYEIEQRQKQIAEERRKYSDERALEASRIWDGLPFATVENGYLQRKKILPHGTRISPDGKLVVPLFNENGDIRSLQYIPQEGKEKRFLSGSSVKGCFWWLGDPETVRVFLCEGFATAASVNEATGCCTFIAFSASALPETARILRKFGKTVTIVADNDKTGIEWANRAENCQVIVVPQEGMDANDYQVETGKLSEVLPDLSIESKMISIDDILQEEIKMSWLIKGWIPDNSIGMVHGPSSSGKTTIVMDMILSAISPKGEWKGNIIRNPLSVVYLCGEGLNGVKARIRAWSAYNLTEVFNNFVVYPLPVDLDSQAGVHIIREQLGTLTWKPDLIVIDTVNRYMSGDENSAQDTRVFLNCVDALRREFSCSGLYIHHTGNNEEAQGRARGSSAWRGALDYEISVGFVDEAKIQRVVRQVKMKDAELKEPMYGHLESVVLPGVYDDDGEPVTSVVFEQDEEPESVADSKLLEIVNEMFCVYTDKAQTNRHINREAWYEWLVEKGICKDREAAKSRLKTGKYRPMSRLLESGILSPEGEGWYIHDKPETHMILGLLDSRK